MENAGSCSHLRLFIFHHAGYRSTSSSVSSSRMLYGSHCALILLLSDGWCCSHVGLCLSVTFWCCLRSAGVSPGPDPSFSLVVERLLEHFFLISSILFLLCSLLSFNSLLCSFLVLYSSCCFRAASFSLLRFFALLVDCDFPSYL